MSLMPQTTSSRIQLPSQRHICDLDLWDHHARPDGQFPEEPLVALGNLGGVIITAQLATW